MAVAVEHWRDNSKESVSRAHFSGLGQLFAENLTKAIAPVSHVA